VHRHRRRTRSSTPAPPLPCARLLFGHRCHAILRSPSPTLLPGGTRHRLLHRARLPSSTMSDAAGLWPQCRCTRLRFLVTAAVTDTTRAATPMAGCPHRRRAHLGAPASPSAHLCCTHLLLLSRCSMKCLNRACFEVLYISACHWEIMLY
jgi:hypothetical protein